MQLKTVVLSLFCALSVGCASYQAHHLQGISSLNAGKYADAESHLRQAIEQGNMYAWLHYGRTMEKMGRTDLAIDAYTKGARFGLSTCADRLRELGKPVPLAVWLRYKVAYDDMIINKSRQFDAAMLGAAASIATVRSINARPAQAEAPRMQATQDDPAASLIKPSPITPTAPPFSISGPTQQAPSMIVEGNRTTIVNGDLATSSDGKTYIRSGNTVFGSDGKTTIQSGNSAFRSDGVTGTQSGSTTFITAPGQPSKTCYNISGTVYCN